MQTTSAIKTLALLALWTLVATARGAPDASAGPPRGASSPSPRHTEVEEVRLVLLPTTVTDRGGRPVRELTADEFILLDQGQPQEIRIFATEADAPVSIAFLLDISASMGLRDRLGEAKRSIGAFVEALGPADSVGLIGFADERVDWITPFTTDRRRFLRRLEVQEPGGRTALLDALGRAPAMVGEAEGGRRAIVLITDGLDNASTVSMLQAVWMARRVRVPIYALSFIPMNPELVSERIRDSLDVLLRFSDETGGRLFAVYRPEDLGQAVSEIQEELRFQYVIGYYPSQANAGGAFRRIELRTSRPHAAVRTRTGYYP